MADRDLAGVLRRWGTWPGLVFIVAGIIFVLQGDSDGWLGIGVGICLGLLALWLAARLDSRP